MATLPFSLQLGPADEGRPVERRLARALPDAGWSYLMKLLRRGQVRLEDGPVLGKGDPLPGRGRLLVAAAPEREGGPRPPAPNRRIRLRVLHEDPHLAVVAKPAPLAMHPGPGHGTDTMLNALIGRWPELGELGVERGWGLVHRLDLETSGCLVIARSAAAWDGLVAAFTARTVQKRYRALARGRPQATRGERSTPVEGKPAHTAWEVLEAAGEVALLALRPSTGRTHQLRIHLAELGHPILGDPRHGAAALPLAGRLGLTRLALHAEALAFAHPVTGEPVACEDPWPRELKRAWARAQRIHGAPRAEEPSSPT